MSPDEAIAYAWQSIKLDQRDLLSPGASEPDRGSAPLSRREAEVAALVAQGLTNRQIAEKIIVTESTAAKHIEHILNKLGLTSRTQIAMWAAEKGLRVAETT